MSTVLITEKIWPQLTSAVSRSRQTCAVAVAYFGTGASKLLPLKKNSRLVVDASERSVASGQTCPAEIAKLVKRGVRAFSVPNLHAKVFVVGRVAYIGSANVSSRSASQLVEAIVRTTDPVAVRAARRFVDDHCLHELTPGVLAHLDKIYRPPQVPSGNVGRRAKDASLQPTLPRLLLAQLRLVDWSEKDQRLHDAALPVAKKRQEHPRSFGLSSFRFTGRCAYRRGDLVIQVVDEGNGRRLVDPPGNVLHVRTRRDGNRKVSFVYLEHPARRRRQVKSMARGLGRGTLKRLLRDGVVRDAAFAQALLKTWS
jgi:hypothetical protein